MFNFQINYSSAPKKPKVT